MPLCSLSSPLCIRFLLTDRGRAVLARLAPAGMGAALSTTISVPIASLQIFALFALWSPSGKIWWQAEGASLALVTALYATAWLLLGKAMVDAGLPLQHAAVGLNTVAAV
jgi:methanethiol S-methyltransferase